MYNDILENELKPIVESLDNLLSLEEEFFTTEVCEKVINYIKSTFKNQVKPELKTSFTRSFKEQFFTEDEANEAGEIIIGAIKEYSSNYNISDNKRKIVDSLLECLKEAYNESTQEYFYKQSKPIIFFELIHPNAQVPIYAHDTDAGADIYIPEDVIIPPAARGFMVHTGLKAVIPNGWEIQIRPRSGLSSKTALRISNAPGTIDAGYRGEICVLCDNLSGQTIELKAGDRIAQMVYAPVTQFTGVVVDNIDTFGSERGSGGFGSSGN